MDDTELRNAVKISCTISPVAEQFIKQQAIEMSKQTGFKVTVSNVVNRILLQAKIDYERINRKESL